ncbi:hypothetical protein AKJ09_07194 [Labilithrix luteola]|uniref:Uncharacterized protein n=1 Tax=Labilithrix luteola TaxID=1391654 RepID=A0A0K1Q3W8_9BACT|nr:hypothetical protein AKJ09_07194 [Labilithrix luteola]
MHRWLDATHRKRRSRKNWRESRAFLGAGARFVRPDAKLASR